MLISEYGTLRAASEKHAHYEEISPGLTMLRNDSIAHEKCCEKYGQIRKALGL